MADVEKADPNLAQRVLLEQQAGTRLHPGDEAAMPNLAIAEKRYDDPVDPSTVVDLQGNKLRYGNTDPNIIGPDDTIPNLLQGSLRDRSKYSSLLPPELFVAEEQWVLPFAIHVAGMLGVDLIDETTYSKIQVQLKQQSIFCVLDLTSPTIKDGTTTWAGLKLWCKEWLVAEVVFHHNIKLRTIFIRHIKLWEKARQGYVNVGDPNGLQALTREQGATILENWLNREQILA